MKDILETNLETKNHVLDSAINDLIEHLFTEKKYQFDTTKVNFDCVLLIKFEIIESNGNIGEIADSAIFFDRFFKFTKKKLAFTLTRNIDDAFVFVKNVEKLMSGGARNGIAGFYKKFKTFVLFKIHIRFRLNFVAYALNLKKGSRTTNLYNFGSSYCNLLPYLESRVEHIYQVLAHLHNEFSDPSVTWNANTAHIREGILKFCESDPKKGSEFFNFTKRQLPVLDELMSTALQGMFVADRKSFWKKLVILSKQSKMRLSVIGVLTSVQAQSAVEAKEYLNLVSSFNNVTEVELINLPRFYCRFLSTQKASKKLKLKVLNELENCLTNTNQNLRVATLRDLSYLDNYDEEVVIWLRKLILLPDFEKTQLDLIDHVFLRNKSLRGLQEILIAYALKFKMENNPNVFDLAVHNFHDDQPEEFSKTLINLITHNHGEVRFFGNRLIQRLTPHNGTFIFKSDILKLDEKAQYKLWVSILTETKEPGQVLPMLLPLLNSKFPAVQEVFISKIEQLCEDYLTSVIEVLEKELDLTSDNNRIILSRIKLYCESFNRMITQKSQIRELNPKFTQAKSFRIHTEGFRKTLSESITENVGKSSFLMQLSTTVILAKGGSWKPENNSEVQKLGHIMTSFQLPRSYFLAPERFDWEVALAYSKNWENNF